MPNTWREVWRTLHMLDGKSNRLLAVVSLSGSVRETNCSKGTKDLFVPEKKFFLEAEDEFLSNIAVGLAFPENTVEICRQHPIRTVFCWVPPVYIFLFLSITNSILLFEVVLRVLFTLKWVERQNSTGNYANSLSKRELSWMTHKKVKTFTAIGRSVLENCALCLESCTQDLGPIFFLIQTFRPVNNTHVRPSNLIIKGNCSIL